MKLVCFQGQWKDFESALEEKLRNISRMYTIEGIFLSS